MPARRRPVDRVIDVMVAVPVSIVAAARELMPFDTSRVEHAVARNLDVIVRYGRRGATASRLAGVGRSGADEPQTPASDPRHSPQRVTPTVDPTVPDDPVTVLPIDGYDQLSARQIVDRLTSLSEHELEVIARHERAGRRRQTILHRIAQLS